MSAAIHSDEQIAYAAPSDIAESPFNPRRTYNEVSLHELAETMKPPHGRVQQPVVVRPHPDPSAGQKFELVFGHRRRRAAIIGELPVVPIIIRNMTDEEVKRAQLIENIGREDVHAIEEAEAFQRLMNEHGLTADDIALQIGKSRSHVYGRLKLLNAVAVVREACLQGKIGAEAALLIARIPTAKLQEKALKRIEGKYLNLSDGGQVSYRRIRALLAEEFTLDLKSAIFDTSDALLLADKGACTTCLELSGNAPEFSDLADKESERFCYGRACGPSICTNPECFAAKKVQHLDNQARELEAKGKVVVAGNKARAAVDAQGNLKDAYIALKDVKDAIKGKDVQILTVQDPRTGKTQQAVLRKDAEEKGALKPETTSKKSSARDRVLSPKLIEAAETRLRDAQAKVRRLYKALLVTPRQPEDLALLARFMCREMDADARMAAGIAADMDVSTATTQELSAWVFLTVFADIADPHALLNDYSLKQLRGGRPHFDHKDVGVLGDEFDAIHDRVMTLLSEEQRAELDAPETPSSTSQDWHFPYPPAVANNDLTVDGDATENDGPAAAGSGVGESDDDRLTEDEKQAA